MKKYCVVITRTGEVFIEAETQEEAMNIADSLYGDDISWSDDWEATDCYEDDSLSDDMYIRNVHKK